MPGSLLSTYLPHLVGALVIRVHQFQGLTLTLLAVAAILACSFREWKEAARFPMYLAINAVIGVGTEVEGRFKTLYIENKC